MTCVRPVCALCAWDLRRLLVGLFLGLRRKSALRSVIFPNIDVMARVLGLDLALGLDLELVFCRLSWRCLASSAFPIA
jgi:hypothetical protein